MQLKEAIRFALGLSDHAVLSAIDEMTSAPTTFPTANGGCHPLWVLGHLALVEGAIPEVLFGEKNTIAEWQQYFGEHSRPVADGSAYPPFAVVREKYRELRKKNLSILESLTEQDLDRPTVAPPKGREREFATWGQTFLTLALHQAMHRSHVTDARRAAKELAIGAPSS